jgi:hypothetical protein
MKAFKVVRRHDDDRYVSAIVDLHGVTVEYIVGQWVGPRIDNSKIFIFTSFSAARNWALDMLGETNFQIWECEVDSIDNTTKLKIIPGLAVKNLIDVLCCWTTGWDRAGQYTNEISESGLCNYIKLVKWVY